MDIQYVGILFGSLCWIIVGFVLYFIPSVIAFRRAHPNRTAIFALNMLLGWTILGWIGALVWSLTSTNK
ncbi:MAG: superinfection immunity protein [Chloroflexota bacterium]|nr:MAG: superinfection immunity protein [Chloroflexota bacterium]